MQKGLTFGFCVEEVGREGWWEMGLQGVQGRWGGRQRGRRSCQRTNVDAGRGLGVGFLKARNKTSRSSWHFSWHYREVTVNVSSG